MIAYQQVEREEALLEPEAENIVKYGSHEARVFEAVRKALDGLSIQDLEKQIGDKTCYETRAGEGFPREVDQEG